MRLFAAARQFTRLASESSRFTPGSFPPQSLRRHVQQSDQLRNFTNSTSRKSKTITSQRLPSELIPPYPYGERQVYKQSNRGLYANARVRYGNIVASSGLSKARRMWRPNIHIKTFYVPELDARIKTRLTLRVLKTIRREGGLLDYLLKSKPARIKELGPSGWRLRWLVMQTRVVQERFNDERRGLGLQPREIVDKDDLIHYALDRATPGPLSKRSQDIHKQIQESKNQVFDLGNDIPEDAEVGEELSDEAEEILLRGVDTGVSDTTPKQLKE